MKALFWSAVINGIVAVPLMIVVIILASRKSVMGAFTASRPIIVLGWVAVAVMGAAAVAMFIPGRSRQRRSKVDFLLKQWWWVRSGIRHASDARPKQKG